MHFLQTPEKFANVRRNVAMEEVWSFLKNGSLLLHQLTDKMSQSCLGSPCLGVETAAPQRSICLHHLLLSPRTSFYL